VGPPDGVRGRAPGGDNLTGLALQIAVIDKSVVSLLAPAYRELRSAELARKVVDGSTAGQFLTS